MKCEVNILVCCRRSSPSETEKELVAATTTEGAFDKLGCDEGFSVSIGRLVGVLEGTPGTGAAVGESPASSIANVGDIVGNKDGPSDGSPTAAVGVGTRLMLGCEDGREAPLGAEDGSASWEGASDVDGIEEGGALAPPTPAVGVGTRLMLGCEDGKEAPLGAEDGSAS